MQSIQELIHPWLKRLANSLYLLLDLGNGALLSLRFSSLSLLLSLTFALLLSVGSRRWSRRVGGRRGDEGNG